MLGTGALILMRFMRCKITTLEIKGGARVPKHNLDTPLRPLLFGPLPGPDPFCSKYDASDMQ